ncbi:MAG TPA: oxidoreductase [Microscillaceae bacterium]|nr:oxidoreductase [Microscillaceae bacterium]
MKNNPKTILITGASTGIGYGCVKEFHRRGYQVFGNVLNAEDAERLRNELGDHFTPLIFDVTNVQSIQNAAKEVEKTLGKDQGLDGLINNAGIAIGGPLMLQPMEQIRQHFEVNIFGLIEVTRAFLPLLGARENHPTTPGRIVNIGSVNGRIAPPFIGAYVGTKHALEGISQSWRRELLLYGIDVVIIRPGSVNTPIWDKGVDVSPYAHTVYGDTTANFAAFAIKEGKSGFSIDYVGNRIANIFEKRKPKTHYALVPKKFKNWTVPRLLPHRMLDRMIGKGVGLIQKQDT